MKTLYKTTLLLAFGLIAGLNISNAQEARSGLKGGINLSNLYLDEADDENLRFGFHVGAYTQLLGPSNMVGFQPEIAFSTKGARGMYDFAGYEGEVKFNLNYVDVPLLAVIKLGEVAEIHGGLYTGYLINANVTTEGDLGSGEDELERDNFNTWDYGLAAGFAFNLEEISIGARYNYGLQELAKSDEAKTLLDDSKNSNTQFFIAFNLN